MKTAFFIALALVPTLRIGAAQSAPAQTRLSFDEVVSSFSDESQLTINRYLGRLGLALMDAQSITVSRLKGSPGMTENGTGNGPKQRVLSITEWNKDFPIKAEAKVTGSLIRSVAKPIRDSLIMASDPQSASPDGFQPEYRVSFEFDDHKTLLFLFGEGKIVIFLPPIKGTEGKVWVMRPATGTIFQILRKIS